MDVSTRDVDGQLSDTREVVSLLDDQNSDRPRQDLQEGAREQEKVAEETSVDGEGDDDGSNDGWMPDLEEEEGEEERLEEGGDADDDGSADGAGGEDAVAKVEEWVDSESVQAHDYTDSDGWEVPSKSLLMYFGSKGSSWFKAYDDAILEHTRRVVREEGLENVRVVSLFVGSGAYEYHLLSEIPGLKVIGFELDHEVANYHQVFHEDPQALFQEADKLWTLLGRVVTRAAWIRLRTFLSSGRGSDIKRAAALLVISRSSYGGKLRSFASQGGGRNDHAARVPAEARNFGPTKNFEIRCADSLEWLEEEGPKLPRGTVLFLDPPYYLDKNHYGTLRGQPLHDHDRQRKALKALPDHVSWILCYNDHDDIDHSYAEFATVTRVRHTLRRRDTSRPITELLIHNLVAAEGEEDDEEENDGEEGADRDDLGVGRLVGGLSAPQKMLQERALNPVHVRALVGRLRHRPPAVNVVDNVRAKARDLAAVQSDLVDAIAGVVVVQPKAAAQAGAAAPARKSDEVLVQRIARLGTGTVATDEMKLAIGFVESLTMFELKKRHNEEKRKTTETTRGKGKKRGKKEKVPNFTKMMMPKLGQSKGWIDDRVSLGEVLTLAPKLISLAFLQGEELSGPVVGNFVPFLRCPALLAYAALVDATNKDPSPKFELHGIEVDVACGWGEGADTAALAAFLQKLCKKHESRPPPQKKPAEPVVTRSPAGRAAKRSRAQPNHSEDGTQVPDAGPAAASTMVERAGPHLHPQQKRSEPEQPRDESVASRPVTRAAKRLCAQNNGEGAPVPDASATAAPVVPNDNTGDTGGGKEARPTAAKNKAAAVPIGDTGGDKDGKRGGGKGKVAAKADGGKGKVSNNEEEEDVEDVPIEDEDHYFDRDDHLDDDDDDDDEMEEDEMGDEDSGAETTTTGAEPATEPEESDPSIREAICEFLKSPTTEDSSAPSRPSTPTKEVRWSEIESAITAGSADLQSVDVPQMISQEVHAIAFAKWARRDVVEKKFSKLASLGLQSLHCEGGGADGNLGKVLVSYPELVRYCLSIKDDEVQVSSYGFFCDHWREFNDMLQQCLRQKHDFFVPTAESVVLTMQMGRLRGTELRMPKPLFPLHFLRANGGTLEPERGHSSSTTPPRQPIIVELFAGIGGLGGGFHDAMRDRVSGTHLFEMKSDACKVLKANFPDATVHQGKIVDGDQLSLPADTEVLAIIGGPPCQPYSSLGNKKGATDDRDGIPVFLKAVETYNPQVVVMENVPGLAKNRKFLKVRRDIQDRLARAGYTVKWRLVNMSRHKIPQSRRRLFVVAFRDKNHADHFTWPEPGREIATVQSVLPPETWDPNTSENPDTKIDDSQVAGMRKRMGNKFADHDITSGGSQTVRTFTTSNLTSSYELVHLLLDDQKTRRKLTFAEAMRLHGYDEAKASSFQWCTLPRTRISHCLGNSVPASYSKLLADHIKEALSNNEEEDAADDLSEGDFDDFTLSLVRTVLKLKPHEPIGQIEKYFEVDAEGDYHMTPHFRELRKAYWTF